MSKKNETKAVAIQTDASEILGNRMKKVLKIVHADFKEQICYVESIDDVGDILESMLGDDDLWQNHHFPVDDIISISVVEIPVAQWEALEEFEGFI